MLGAIMMAGIGIAQGYGTYKQGKQMAGVGDNIKKYYRALEDKKDDLEKREKLGKETAKNIKEEQHKQASNQYDFNKKEIKRALETNLRGLLVQHSSLRDDLSKEISDMKGRLAFAFDKKNVEESSIKNDSLNKLNNEVLEKTNILIENQFQDIKEMGIQGANQQYQNDLQLNRTKEGINQNYLVSLTNSEMQLQHDLNSLNNFITSGVNRGEQYIQQGYNIKAQGANEITSSVLNFGKTAFNKFGGLTGITSSLFGQDKADKLDVFMNKWG